MATVVPQVVTSCHQMEEMSFEDACGRLSAIFAQVREAWVRASGILGHLNELEIKKVKKMFRGIISADHIDRLRMLGDGRLAAYLAVPEKSIPSGKLKSFPKAVLTELNRGERKIEVWSPRRVVVKALHQLSSPELVQVVDDRGKLRSAEEQRGFCLAALRKQKKSDKSAKSSDFLEVDALSLSHAGDSVVFRLRLAEDPIGETRYRVAVPVKTLRGFCRA